MRRQDAAPRRRRKTSRLLKRLPRWNYWATGWGFRPSSATCFSSARRWSWTRASPAFAPAPRTIRKKTSRPSRWRWRLFDEPSWDALSPERPLRFWRLIEISQFGAQPLTASALRADERIVNYLKGLNYLDERISSLLSPLELSADALELAASQESRASYFAALAARGGNRLAARRATRRRRSSEQTTRRPSRGGGLNRQLHRLPVESLPANHADLELLARLWRARKPPVAAGALSRRGRLERPGRTFRAR